MSPELAHVRLVCGSNSDAHRLQGLQDVLHAVSCCTVNSSSCACLGHAKGGQHLCQQPDYHTALSARHTETVAPYRYNIRSGLTDANECFLPCKM